jgi:hypothetical protein
MGSSRAAIRASARPQAGRTFGRSSPVRSYWLARCEGFRLQRDGGASGLVERVVVDEFHGEAKALVVRVGRIIHRRVMVSPDEIDAVAPFDDTLLAARPRPAQAPLLRPSGTRRRLSTTFRATRAAAGTAARSGGRAGGCVARAARRRAPQIARWVAQRAVQLVYLITRAVAVAAGCLSVWAERFAPVAGRATLRVARVGMNGAGQTVAATRRSAPVVALTARKGLARAGEPMLRQTRSAIARCRTSSMSAAGRTPRRADRRPPST